VDGLTSTRRDLEDRRGKRGKTGKTTLRSAGPYDKVPPLRRRAPPKERDNRRSGLSAYTVAVTGGRDVIIASEQIPLSYKAQSLTNGG